MKTIDQISFNGKRALIRVDFNVPLDEGLQHYR
jgi:phosphoglycerate kinase